MAVGKGTDSRGKAKPLRPAAAEMSTQAPPETAALLETRLLAKHFGGVNAVSDINFRLAGGEVRGLIGPNGAGKTCFLNLLSGIYRPSSGAILYQGGDITEQPSRMRSPIGIGRTFQVAQLCDDMSVLENALLGFYPRMKGGVSSALFRQKSLRREREVLTAEARRLLEFVGLNGLEQTSAGALAYGQKKRLDLARAIANKPDLLLLDEPTAGLNPQEVDHLKGLIEQINRDRVTVLVVEHNMRFIMDLCQRISVLSSGTMIAEGTPREIRNNQDVIGVYLGKRWHHAEGQ